MKLFKFFKKKLKEKEFNEPLFAVIQQYLGQFHGTKYEVPQKIEYDIEIK